MSLANDYRPQSWDDVTEQGLTVKILKNICEQETLSCRNFLLTGPAGTGKTTIARLVAKKLNDGIDDCEIIEVDGASTNGADAARDISTQAKSYPVVGKYKCIVYDECVTGDVEILTSHGFKRFDACDGTEEVAQYTDEGNIEFVTPLKWIKNPYAGDLIQWNPREWCSVKMTPNHVQPLYYVKSNQIKEKYISDVHFNANNRLIVAGKGVGNMTTLSAIDRLAIASQADGTIQSINRDYVHWSISFKKQRKIDRFLDICIKGNIPYTEISAKEGYRRFTYDLPLSTSKLLSTHFNLNVIGYNYAREFIEELSHWDGYVTKYMIQYVSTVKENCDFVSAVACLGGYSARQSVETDNRKTTYQDSHKVYIYDNSMTSCQRINHTMRRVSFDGYVYCVKVPSHKIVVRSEGFVFVTGNCHALSSSAWSVLLKVLEEQPARTVWLLATTNPEKIPKTITSRVQQFQLSKISLQGIENRLKYVLDSEIAKGKPYTYTAEGLSLIAKLANGGMRDALSLTDKALAYNTNITSENVTASLISFNYNDFFGLLGAIAKKDNAQIAEIVDMVYNSGTNFVRWFEDFHAFTINVAKFIVLQDITKTMIPSHFSEKLSKYNMKHYTICLKLANVLMMMNQELRTTNYQQEVVLTKLCSVQKKAGESQ